MKKIKLLAEKRQITGKKVKQLRKQGWLPGNVYGKKVTSQAVQIKTEDLIKTFKEAGETSIVDLALDKESRPVLIQNLQIHPVTQVPLHVDLYQVDLKEKIKAHVPIEVVGVPEAVEQKIGALLELLDEIEVEALPTDLPEKIVINVEKLAKVNDSVKVKDLSLPEVVKVLVDGDTEVVKIGELVTKEAEALAQEEAAAAAALAATAEPTTTAAEVNAPTPEKVEAAPAAQKQEK